MTTKTMHINSLFQWRENIKIRELTKEETKIRGRRVCVIN
jgi:hypothetical protein